MDIEHISLLFDVALHFAYHFSHLIGISLHHIKSTILDRPGSQIEHLLGQLIALELWLSLALWTNQNYPKSSGLRDVTLFWLEVVSFLIDIPRSSIYIELAEFSIYNAFNFSFACLIYLLRHKYRLSADYFQSINAHIEISSYHNVILWSKFT